MAQIHAAGPTGARSPGLDAAIESYLTEHPPEGGGGGVSDHGDLTGLADDDHAQYALADGSRGNFAPAAHSHNHSTLAGLSNDDHTQYALADGTRGGFAALGHDHVYEWQPPIYEDLTAVAEALDDEEIQIGQIVAVVATGT